MNKLKIISSKYYVDKLFINGDPCRIINNNYSIVIDNNTYIDIFLLPKYFQSKAATKLFLYFVDNVFSQGGFNVKQLRKRIDGIHIYGQISGDTSTIDVENFQLIGLNYEKYSSKKLLALFYLLFFIPLLLILILVVLFLAWAAVKIIF